MELIEVFPWNLPAYLSPGAGPAPIIVTSFYQPCSVPGTPLVAGEQVYTCEASSEERQGFVGGRYGID